MITVNSVFKYDDGERIRIIDIIDKYAYLVNIDGATSMPKKELIKTIEDEIQADKLIAIKDPFIRIIDESELSKTQINKREQDWQFILKYWEVNKYEILEKNSRNKSHKTLLSLVNLNRQNFN